MIAYGIFGVFDAGVGMDITRTDFIHPVFDFGFSPVFSDDDLAYVVFPACDGLVYENGIQVTVFAARIAFFHRAQTLVYHNVFLCRFRLLAFRIQAHDL
jgi:hypothetical protein